MISGIYLLKQDNVVIYVGKTTRGLSRIMQHERNKQFNSFEFILYPAEELDKWEAHYIKTLNPSLNISQNNHFIRIDYIDYLERKRFTFRPNTANKEIIQQYHDELIKVNTIYLTQNLMKYGAKLANTNISDIDYQKIISIYLAIKEAIKFRKAAKHLKIPLEKSAMPDDLNLLPKIEKKPRGWNLRKMPAN